MGLSCKSSLPSIYFSTIITICSLYAAQPIQPVFQQEFALSRPQAILFTTLMMMPLGVAPLFYGYLLETFSAKFLVRGAILALGVLEIVFSMAGSYLSLILIRAIQGVMIPAILTSLMSYISYSSSRENVQHSIALYIAATIMGGFLGRFLSGLFTDLFGWRIFFFVLGILLLLAFFLLGCLERNVKLTYERPNMHQVALLLREGRFRWLYLAIFCIFFVFSALMNFLPFELKKINPAFREAGIGLLYLGYSMGILVSVNTRRIIGYFGNEPDAIIAGIGIFFLGTMIFFVENYQVMFIGMFVFCTGLFMAHSLLSGLVNKLTQDNKALANGVYISFYYMGGTLGSFLPGVFFEHFGWRVFLLSLLIMLVIALFFAGRLKHAVRLLPGRGVNQGLSKGS
jgi:MFS transporter, YNFM family, putative membrane transport protein